MSQPIQNELPSETSSSRPLEDERELLALEKLRLEVEVLQRPWWRAPSNLSPIATICAAVFGIVWGIASGFFDISRRELDVRRKELESETRALQEKRDEQTKEFRAEAIAQNKVISSLRQKEESLRNRLAKLDKPILLGVGYRMDSFSDVDDEQLVFAYISGENLGDGVGRVSSRGLSGECEIRTPSLGWQGFVSEQLIPITIVRWSRTEIAITLRQHDVRVAFQDAARHRIAPGFVERGACRGALRLQVERADKRQSNAGLEIPGYWLDAAKSNILETPQNPS